MFQNVPMQTYISGISVGIDNPGVEYCVLKMSTSNHDPKACKLVEELKALFRHKKKTTVGHKKCQHEDASLKRPECIAERSIYRVPGLLSEQECKRCIYAAESSSLFEHQSSPNSPDYAFRSHYRIKVHSPEVAMLVWNHTGLKDIFIDSVMSKTCVGSPVGLHPDIRIYKYNAGKERFGKHIDESQQVGRGRTEYTLLIYLSTTKGGDTVFYDERGRVVVGVEPRAGMALFHRHGERHCLEHEALEVREGCKYVLRSDIVFSP